MHRFVTALSVVFVMSCPERVAAHPGHGPEIGLAHFLTDPFHVAIGVVIAAFAAAFFVGRRHRSRQTGN